MTVELQYVGVVRIPKMLTRAEYSNVHFIGWFCSASTRAAVVDCQLQYPLRRTYNFKTFESIQGAVGEAGSFPCINTGHGNDCMKNVVF